MKITLGGKISITYIVICSTIWATLLVVGEHLSGDLQQFAGFALYFLSFPVGWLSGIFSAGHGRSSSHAISYLLLMIPNAFLLGYSIAGVFHLFRYVCRRSRSKA